MRYLIKTLLFILICFIPLHMSGADDKKPNPRKKKKKEIVMETTKLGKNKLFFSKKYQKKLKKNMKRKGKRR